MLKLLFITIAFFVSTSALAQNEDVISYFNASELNGKVLLTWAIKQGNTCNGVQILRSTDSVNFTQIGSINGICGSTQAEVAYEFTDADPIVNSINYYRLSLGGIGFSWIVFVEVIDVSNDYLIRPNPIIEQAELHFRNETSNRIELKVFDNAGNLIYEEETIQNKFILKKSNFTSGIFFFTLFDSVRDNTIKGRFEIQ